MNLIPALSGAAGPPGANGGPVPYGQQCTKVIDPKDEGVDPNMVVVIQVSECVCVCVCLGVL